MNRLKMKSSSSELDPIPHYSDENPTTLHYVPSSSNVTSTSSVVWS